MKTTTTTTNSNLKGMTAALRIAHECNNSKAISKEFARGAGVPTPIYQDWVDWIEKTLYPAALTVGRSYNNHEVSDDTLVTAEATVQGIWEQMSDLFNKSNHPHLFTRRTDPSRICGYAVRFGYSVRGTIEAEAGAKSFRQSVETLLGIRMAQNAVLTFDQYEIIRTYDKAQSRLDSAEQSLNGYERNGKHVPGAIDKLADAEAKLAEMKEAAKALGVSESDIDSHPLIQGYAEAVKTAKKAVKDLKSKIKDYNDVIKDNKKSYNDIMESINEIKE